MVGVQSSRAEDVQATFCATLVDEWIRLGVKHAVVSPGSRSTPLALAIAARADIAVHVVHDERSAAFVALGLGLDGMPALLLCTSGTAAANFFPAVVEAGLSAVPMLVLTADRPDELRNVGAPQTIDQLNLFGEHVRWFRDAPVAEAAASGGWRMLASTAFDRATDGPVQLNLPFREPLVGVAGELPEEPAEHLPLVQDASSDPVPTGVAHQRGVILVGGRSGVNEADVAQLHERTGWPILADPLSALRHLDGVVTSADSILRHQPFADANEAAVIVRIGRPATSKVLAQWTARPGGVLIQVGGPVRIDPDHNVDAVCGMDDLLTTEFAAPDPGWLASWRQADAVASTAIESAIESCTELTEPAVARLVAARLPAEAGLTVSSSMPVRDLEWFGGSPARAHANRGANGIDGVVSTALGRALLGRPEVVLIGDLAFVHDSNALLGLGARGADLRVVVVDNDGGGIFSFLPQAQLLSHDRFEQLFGTPLATDVLALAAAYGVPTVEIGSAEELEAQLGTPGPWVARVASNRDRNVEVHAALHAAVADALG